MTTAAPAERLALAPLQHAMALGHLVAPTRGFDIEQVIGELPEELDADLFRQAWQATVARQPVLRTAVHWDASGDATQSVSDVAAVPFSFEDWSADDTVDRGRRFDAFLAADRRRGFDLGSPPLLRVALFRHGPAEHRLVWSFHHLLLDGRSFAAVLDEVFETYAALVEGREPELAPVQPFARYVAWLDERDAAADSRFWAEVLRDWEGPSPLPGAKPTPDAEAMDAGLPGEVEVGLGPDRTARLRTLAADAGVTLNTVVQAAWALVLARSTDARDVTFGVIRSCRGTVPEDLRDALGLLINTLPMRVAVDETRPLSEWLGSVRQTWTAIRPHEHASLREIQRAAGLSGNEPLFESVLNFQEPAWHDLLAARGGAWSGRTFRNIDRPNVPLVVYAYAGNELLLRLKYDRGRFGESAASGLLDRLVALLNDMASRPAATVGELSAWTGAEQRRLDELNATDRPVDDRPVHEQFEAQVARSPDATAVVFGEESVTFAELNARANRLARRLQALGAGSETRVAICVERSVEMVVGLLGILKAGGAYVPLDPTYPADRLRLMLDDCGASSLVTQSWLARRLPDFAGAAIHLDREDLSSHDADDLGRTSGPENLAYLIYTSGSTGTPKGVMIEHRQVANFFAGMDDRLGTDPGVWLAVTSISFDISVLELFWSLSRGYKLVIHPDERAAAKRNPAASVSKDAGIDFSLFYFASDERASFDRKYRLLLDGARFADSNGFSAIWTPERHFHAFGGLYPSPAVAGAAVAAITERIGIRAGSVVLPLHHPIRVVEDWAVVDNLSNGRVGVSFASGWHDVDFVLAPDRYTERRDVMFREIETVRRLWRGEPYRGEGGSGKEVEVSLLPRPIQPELPVWVTAAGSPSTFERAGEIGANLLTHLLGQSPADLEAKVAAYRKAWRDAGHGPGAGRVTLMLHTYLGEDVASVREIVREPFTAYLQTAVDLIKGIAQERGQDLRSGKLSDADMDAILAHAFDRYFETSALFGTPESTGEVVERLRAAGVDEIACLIDFGVDQDLVFSGLQRLAALQDRMRGTGNGRHLPGSTFAELVERHGVTHLQCTPSLAAMLLAEPSAARSLGSLDTILLGGEALPPALVQRLRSVTAAGILNMYGPTETTIWSTVAAIDGADRVVIGRPIANTRVYIVDDAMRPVPWGAAGELLIGGEGVARGYWNRPDLTADRFPADPFGGAEGRVYRTGDRVRLTEDGVLEFLGRTDHQVKVRGHRIELGEIEAHLSTHPGIRRAVVVAESGDGDHRLVAYIVTGGRNGGPASNELRRFLRARLPDVMVPADFVTLEELPLTPNGKLDRKALRPPAGPPVGRPNVTERPRSATEEAVAGVWKEVLNVPEVRLHDDFFVLGGNSLSAVRITFRLRETFDVEFPLQSFFAAPTVRGIAERIEAMLRSEPTDEVTEQLAPARPSVEPDRENRYAPFPLTDLQQAYWVGRTGEFDVGDVATHSYVELEGRGLDIARLESAWVRVIDRHDMLRAVILSDGTQRVLEQAESYRIAVDDVRTLPAADAERRLDEVRRTMSHQVMPSDRWPLFDIRATLLPDDRVRLHLGFDGLILDGWSMTILVREWNEFYADPDLELPPLEFGFRDYVLAERAMESTPAFERARAYWQERVTSLPGAPALPLRGSTDAGESTFVRRSFVLGDEAWDRFKAGAAEAGITPAGALLAAYADVLATWTGTSRFTLNVPRFNRRPVHPEVDRIAGEFASLTLLEIENIAGTFAERAKRHQTQLWRDLDHAEYNGVRVMRDLAQSMGNPSGALMPVVFTSAPKDESGQDMTLMTASGAIGQPVYRINQSSQVWLDLHVSEHGGTLRCDLDSVDSVFPPGLPQDFFEALERHVGALARDPDAWTETRGEAAGRLLPRQQAMARAEINSRVAELPDILAHDLVATQVRERPNQPAVETTSRTLTYAELWHAAGHWARRLLDHGVGPDRNVAVVMDKGWEQVVAVLAVLRAGGTYLPADAAMPEERLHYVLRNGEVPVVLTQSHLAEALRWPPELTVLVIEPELDGDRDAALPDDAPRAGPDDLLYVLYTSGSTGEPKGVMTPHRGIVNAVLRTNETFGVGPADRVLGLTALHHDMSAYDIFGVLGAGGTLVLPDADGTREPAHWAELMRRHEITLWNSVPAMMEMLLEHVEATKDALPSSLRLAFLGGDWIPLWIPERLETQVPGARVVSVGGPTETTLWNIWYPVEAVDPVWTSIPYGQPIPNVKYAILNDILENCPTWVPGEMCCAGVGLARGYWRDEERTAERFFVHPRTGERMYRTGDRGRYLPDGHIEFLGRLDLQVKIQGQRIELGEIESALQRHPDVRQAVVGTASTTSGKKRLVAYVVPDRAGAPPAEERLREFLASKLPDHMVPAVFVPLERLPLTRNGKVDRRGLPDPEAAAVSATATPRGILAGTRARIARIVASVLEIPDVEPEVSILSYGANSIDMIRLGNRLEETFGSRPRIAELFRLQTVNALADYYQARGLRDEADEGAGLTGADAELRQLLAKFPLLHEPAERDAFKNSRPGIRVVAGERLLPLPAAGDTGPIDDVLDRRRSRRTFSLSPIPMERLARFLEPLRATPEGDALRYRYASPGGLYPGQVYLHIKNGRVEGLDGGTYYYHPVEHALVLLEAGVEIDRDIHIPFINTPIYDEAAFSIFLLAQLSAIAPAYGEKSLHFVTLEAGILAHHLELSAAACDLGLCQIGSIDFDRIRAWFHLDESHVQVHSLVGGMPAGESEPDGDAGAAMSPEARRAARALERVRGLSSDEVRKLLDAKRRSDGKA